MGSLRTLGVLAIVLFVAGVYLVGPSSPLAAGRDATGRAVFSGFIAFLFWGAAMIVSGIAFRRSLRAEPRPDRVTLLLARGPFLLLVGGLVAGFLFSVALGCGLDSTP